MLGVEHTAYIPYRRQKGARKLPHILFLSLLLLLFPLSPLAQENSCRWEVFFSPHGGCTDAIVHQLNGAKTSILVQAYSFISSDIAKALLKAHKRGVKADVILDKSQTGKKGGYSPAMFLSNQGIPIKIDAVHAIAHNKIIILDGEAVITGSFNFTRAAEEKNAENLIIPHDKKIASLYVKNCQEHAQHSEVYGGRSERCRGGMQSRQSSGPLSGWIRCRQISLGRWCVKSTSLAVRPFERIPSKAWRIL